MPNNLIGKSHTITDIYQYLSELGYVMLHPVHSHPPIDWHHPPENSIALYDDDQTRLIVC
jgi:hypothetical protein